MGLLSDSDIASMRAQAAEALPSTGTIKRRVETSDGQGGREESFKDRAKDIPCRLDPVRQQGAGEQARGGRISADSDYLVTFEAETEVNPNDVIVINGRTFEVDRVRDREEWEITLRVEASEIDIGGPAGES